MIQELPFKYCGVSTGLQRAVSADNLPFDPPLRLTVTERQSEVANSVSTHAVDLGNSRKGT
jgi:recombinational DNA repair protein RecT